MRLTAPPAHLHTRLPLLALPLLLDLEAVYTLGKTVYNSGHSQSREEQTKDPGKSEFQNSHPPGAKLSSHALGAVTAGGKDDTICGYHTKGFAGGPALSPLQNKL